MGTAMRDIQGLKQRIDYAERHLNSTESARHRESEALMEMWRQIRDRFAEQEKQIARYRSQVEGLTGNNEDLSRMVDDLIATVEGNLERGRDETVPNITSLAEELMRVEPEADDAFALADEEPQPEAWSTGPVAEPDGTIEPIELDDGLAADDVDFDMSEPDDGSDLSEAPEDDHPEPPRAVEPSISPGIRNLLSRLQSAVGPGSKRDAEAENGTDPAAPMDRDQWDQDQEGEDALARELKEIEALRMELSGLRDRISSDG